MLKTPLDAANKYINQKYEDVILKVKQFVNESGGGLNSAVVAVNVAIDSDAGKKTKEGLEINYYLLNTFLSLINSSLK